MKSNNTATSSFSRLHVTSNMSLHQTRYQPPAFWKDPFGCGRDCPGQFVTYDADAVENSLLSVPADEKAPVNSGKLELKNLFSTVNQNSKPYSGLSIPDNCSFLNKSASDIGPSNRKLSNQAETTERVVFRYQLEAAQGTCNKLWQLIPEIEKHDRFDVEAMVELAETDIQYLQQFPEGVSDLVLSAVATRRQLHLATLRIRKHYATKDKVVVKANPPYKPQMAIVAPPPEVSQKPPWLQTKIDAQKKIYISNLQDEIKVMDKAFFKMETEHKEATQRYKAKRMKMDDEYAKMNAKMQENLGCDIQEFRRKYVATNTLSESKTSSVSKISLASETSSTSKTLSVSKTLVASKTSSASKLSPSQYPVGTSPLAEHFPPLPKSFLNIEKSVTHPCLFCDGDHHTFLCTKVNTLQARQRMHKEKNICTICGVRHNKKNSQEPKRCTRPKYCKWLHCMAMFDHLSNLCPKANYPIEETIVEGWWQALTDRQVASKAFYRKQSNGAKQKTEERTNVSDILPAK